VGQHSLPGAAALVTGAAGGIGRAVCLRLAAAGAHVLAVDLSRAGLDDVVSSAGGLDGRVVSLEADVTDPAEVDGAVRQTVREFGKLELLHANAGLVGPHTSIEDTTLEDWRRAVALNLDAVFYALKYGMPAIRSAGGGAIVITGSILSLKAAPRGADYTATKHGVLGLARTAASEGAAHGISVNCICPGPIETQMMSLSERLMDPSDPGAERQRFHSTIPMGRYGSPNEIAELVCFLLSRRVPYLTGAAVAVDGGLTAV
jgi:NAD(P)-dependent dehydrogenase (short-subunit alcohol dehydrogenase family)